MERTAWVLTELMVSSYFLIESTPEEIMRRRENDPTRSRDEDTVKDIDEHQQEAQEDNLLETLLTYAYL